MPSYGLVIRTELCTGCQACSVACKMENLTLPGCDRNRITEQPHSLWSVELCMHCEQPPCVPVCPADATWKNDSGITVVDQTACIGCGQCVEACPYTARHLNPEKGYFEEPLPYEKAALSSHAAHRIHVANKADKCDFCLHLIEKGSDPMCVEACTTSALIFGDLDDPSSPIRSLVDRGARPMKPELGTRPRVFYL